MAIRQVLWSSEQYLAAGREIIGGVGLPRGFKIEMLHATYQAAHLPVYCLIGQCQIRKLCQ